jgi:GT2 family glycosyltransferase
LSAPTRRLDAPGAARIGTEAAGATAAVRVSVVVVNWNGLAHLPVCLASLRDQTFRDLEVVLVDNGSDDGSVAWVRAHHPEVRLIELAANAGFAGGNEAGLAACRGEWIFTLNNDTRVDPRCVEELVLAADADPRIGMVGCRVCSFDEPDRIDSLGVALAPDGMSRGAHRLERFSTMRVGVIEDILLPSACAALYRRAMLDEIGFFDRDFFAYCEDTDLGLRARLAGWRAVLATRAVVLHRYSLTGGSFSSFKLYLVERNHYWVAVKNFPLPLLAALPAWTALRFCVQAAMVVGGRGSGREFRASGAPGALLRAVARGVLDGAAGAPRMWAKRRRAARLRRLSTREALRLFGAHRLRFTDLLDGRAAGAG